jgi:spore coat protein U-like protein
MKPRIQMLLMLGLMPWAELHAQQPVSTTIRVQARVEGVCEVTATGFNSGRGPVAGAVLLRTTCTPDSSYKISLNRLAAESSQGVVWGNPTGTDAVTGIGTGVSQDHTLVGGDVETVSVRIYY